MGAIRPQLRPMAIRDVSLKITAIWSRKGAIRWAGHFRTSQRRASPQSVAGCPAWWAAARYSTCCAGSQVSCGSSQQAEKGKPAVLWPVLVTICLCHNRTHRDPGVGKIEFIYFFNALFNALKNLLKWGNDEGLGVRTVFESWLSYLLPGDLGQVTLDLLHTSKCQFSHLCKRACNTT